MACHTLIDQLIQVLTTYHIPKFTFTEFRCSMPLAIPLVNCRNWGSMGLTMLKSGTLHRLTYTSKHQDFFLTGYMCLISHSTDVASVSRSTVESTMRVLRSYCMHSSFSALCYSSVRVPSSRVLQLAVI